MYTVSFYSFKGGVGRTMAMANVGAQLAQTGRKVLMVDFDLEAPGLGTYDFHRSNVETPGIVEFVNEYLRTNQAPRVNDYLYHSPGFGKEGGDLWIMPAGIQDENYESKFSNIDWKDLYKNKKGFLLMEDLKQQWQKELEVDYVLLDSRTGHSDVAGICTRQLPDAVVLMMFPNMQNLIGLTKITSDIKKHEASPGATKIKQHYVVSNVPDLDDEDHILENTFEKFRNQLGYDEPSAIIHRYQSLALLNQDLFLVTRPRTRLAAEYKHLTNEIVLYNDEDKEGAVDYLTRALKLRQPEFVRGRFKADEIETRAKNLEEQHGNDPDILFLLGQFNHRKDNLEDALALYKQAEKNGMDSAELFTAMVNIQDRAEDKLGALDSIKKVLNHEDASYIDVVNAAKVLSRIAPEEMNSIENAPALVSMDSDDQMYVANRLSNIKEGVEVSRKIINRLKGSDGVSDKAERIGSSILALGLIAEKNFLEAIQELSSDIDPDFNELNIEETFNIAMARWGQDGSPNVALFQRVVDKDKDFDGKKGLNYTQCMAIANFAVGDKSEAMVRLKKAKLLASKGPVREFSAWSYSEVNQIKFKEHLSEMQKMIEGKDVRPSFIGGQIDLKLAGKK